MKKLFTEYNEVIEIIKSGIHNKNTGTDFLNAELKIDNQLWVGNVEIHIKSSDWYLHNHENDENYDAVILHVVWENDSPIYMKNNQPIPTLVLKDLVNSKLLISYQNLISTQNRWIPCEHQISSVDNFVIDNWLERLYFERLEHKSKSINELLKNENNNFEAVLFQLTAKNFGLKINGDAFLSLAQSIHFSIIRKERFNKESFMALLFGQAGFLEDASEEIYQQNLKKEYEYLKYKYKLNSISKNNFQFFRMRPNNFPTIRIAQLVALFHQQENLFSKVIEIDKLDHFYKLFSITIDDFWQTHYTFETLSKKSAKKLSKSFLDLILINTIIPLQFVYQQQKGSVNQERIVKLINAIKPEKNAIIERFSELGIKSKSAFKTQSLLELKNNYCAPKRCLECAIGNKILGKI